jgi:putative MATE family efflux protein
MFNQSQVLGMVVGALVLIVGMLLRTRYATAMSADAETAALAAEYLLWFIPALALQFVMVAMGSALRGIGNFRPGMIVSTASLLVNMVAAPFLIFGWGTGRPLGVAGAAIATLIAMVVAIVWFMLYFLPQDSFLRFTFADWRPRIDVWKRMLNIGLPAGFEFGLMALYMFIVYSISRPFGAAAQAGFGIGMRIIQAGFMPVVALGFSVAPVAGQNYGARLAQRVKDTFRSAAYMATAAMIVFAALSHLAPEALVSFFSTDPAAIHVGAQYLRIVSWNYVASGLIFVASSTFQAMGNTVPSLIASGVRILIVALPAYLLARLPAFQLHWIWYLSVIAVIIQLAISMLLLRREFARKLNFASVEPSVSTPTAA